MGDNIAIWGVIWLIITCVGFFSMIVLSSYFYFRARNRERMALIEKGGDLSKFFGEPNDHLLFKNGMFLIGLAIGLLMGYLMAMILPIPDVVAYFSMILLFGGLSLILYYPVSAKYLKKGDDGK